jgi:hypothetical protein
MKDENVIIGRAWGFGLFVLFIGALGFFLVSVGVVGLIVATEEIDESHWAVILFGLLLALVGLPVGIYALLPKKMVFGKFDVCYWIVKKKKFELLWTDIIKLESRMSHGKYRTSFIDIHTSEKNIL